MADRQIHPAPSLGTPTRQLRRGPAEAVDGLLVVADEHHATVRAENTAKPVENAQLHGTRILILVHQQHAEASANPIKHRRFPQRLDRKLLHVGKIHHAGLLLEKLKTFPAVLGKAEHATDQRHDVPMKLRRRQRSEAQFREFLPKGGVSAVQGRPIRENQSFQRMCPTGRLFTNA